MLLFSNEFGAAISSANRLDRICLHDSIDRQNDGHTAAPQLLYRNVREILKLRMLQKFSNVVSPGSTASLSRRRFLSVLSAQVPDYCYYFGVPNRLLRF